MHHDSCMISPRSIVELTHSSSSLEIEVYHAGPYDFSLYLASAELTGSFLVCIFRSRSLFPRIAVSAVIHIDAAPKLAAFLIALAEFSLDYELPGQTRSPYEPKKHDTDLSGCM